MCDDAGCCFLVAKHQSLCHTSDRCQEGAAGPCETWSVGEIHTKPGRGQVRRGTLLQAPPKQSYADEPCILRHNIVLPSSHSWEGLKARCSARPPLSFRQLRTFFAGLWGLDDLQDPVRGGYQELLRVMFKCGEVRIDNCISLGDCGSGVGGPSASWWLCA